MKNFHKKINMRRGFDILIDGQAEMGMSVHVKKNGYNR